MPITLASRVWVGGLFEASLDYMMRPCLKNQSSSTTTNKRKEKNSLLLHESSFWASECSFYIVPCSCSMEAISSNISVRTLVRGCFSVCLSVCLSHSHSLFSEAFFCLPCGLCSSWAAFFCLGLFPSRSPLGFGDFQLFSLFSFCGVSIPYLKLLDADLGIFIHI